MADELTGTTFEQSTTERGRELLARMDRFPAWPLRKRDFLVIGIAYFFVFYDISDIGFAMPAIDEQMNLGQDMSLFVALAVGLVGYIIGSLLAGWLSDAKGRKVSFIGSLVFSGAGSLLCGFSFTVWDLSLWRFLTGMGVGAALNLASTYVGEIAPANQRGKLSVATFMVGIIGQAITPFGALALVPNFHTGWRWLFFIGALVGVFGVLFALALPESPRWLISQWRCDDAEKIIEKMETNFTDEQLRKGQKIHEEFRKEVEKEEERQDRSLGLTGTDSAPSLTEGKYLRTAIVMALMWFLWYIGNYGFLGDAPDLISSHGENIAGSILYLAIGAIGYPTGALIMIFISDKFERKYLIFVCTLVWAAGMLCIATMASSFMVTLGSFLASMALGSYLQMGYTFTAESFPTTLRARGFSIADGCGHLGGAVGSLLLPFVVNKTSFFAGFAMIALTGVAAGLLALTGPKSSSRSLEDI